MSAVVFRRASSWLRVPRGCLVVARTAYAGQVGVYGESAYLDGEAHLALTEVEPSDAPSAPTASLGTLRRGHGTAMVLRADDVAEARRVAARLAELQRSGVLYDLLRERTTAGLRNRLLEQT